MILCINAQAAPGTWPKASDEADGTGRPQPGFFRMHRPGHFSLVPGSLTLERSKDRLSLVYPLDLAPNTPSQTSDNDNFSPSLGTSDPNSLKFPNKLPLRGGTLSSRAWILWL